MDHSDAEERAFCSVIAWPEGLDRAGAAALVAEAAAAHHALDDALSIHDLRLRASLTPPLVLGHLRTGLAHAICRTVRAQGGDAFAPTLGDLAALGPTLKIRDLRIVGGDLDVTLWRGPEARIRRSSILCLIRAHLSETTTIRPIGRQHIPQLHTLSTIPASTRAPTATTRLQTSDKLDVHTSDGSVFQLDGDKFGYGVLGDQRGHSDKHNMDRMFELLQHLAEHAVPDMYFQLWKPPPAYDQLRIPHARINNDDPAFAFYSRWCARMYRHILDQAA